MSEGIDEGDIILQQPLDIGPDDTAGILSEKLASLAAILLLGSLEKIGEGRTDYIPQDDDKATYAPRLRKSDGLIDWRTSARDIHNLVRGLNPRPGAYTYIKGGEGNERKMLKIWKTEPITHYPLPITHRGQPGEIMEIIRDKGLVVATTEGLLLVKEVQGEGGKKMSVGEYLRGYSLKVGCVFWKGGQIKT